jgi:hypothetical protein
LGAAPCDLLTIRKRIKILLSWKLVPFLQLIGKRMQKIGQGRPLPGSRVCRPEVSRGKKFQAAKIAEGGS